jgi:cytochrome oxidase Cu insertion factor (SCO1/SenC/PrrC family)
MKKGLVILIVVVLLFGAYYLFADDIFGETSGTTEVGVSVETSSGAAESSGNVLWKEIELTDIRTGDSFTIENFSGETVLLESFAVWCPTCTKQQRKIMEFHEEVGDSVVSISIDTDSNEDSARVLEHIQDNGFDWRYAISPATMTQALIDEFGPGIVNAPSVPMILICPDGSYSKLGNGVKDVGELKEAVASCAG